MNINIDGDMSYLDAFVAGWHLNACSYQREHIVATQEKNNKFHKTDSTALVDGYDARNRELGYGLPVEQSTKKV
jgi:hypothetical protein